MEYTMPFTTDSVKKEICGRTMVVGRRVGAHAVEKVKELVLLSVPRTKDVHWEVVDGVLIVLDERMSPVYVVNSVEVANNKAFLSGEMPRSASRMVMYEKQNLETNFQIFVSSHATYEEVAVPRLIRSLVREGVPMEQVTVVVGGCEEEGLAVVEQGYTRVALVENLMGCTALSYLATQSFDMPADYALVLHDTCEVVPGFRQTISQLDVGLPYDLVEGMREISLWSKGFLKRIAGTSCLAASPYEIFTMVNAMCRLNRKVGQPNLLRSRDVYGAGVKRDVLELPELGVRKFAGHAMTGGRP